MRREWILLMDEIEGIFNNRTLTHVSHFHEYIKKRTHQILA